MYHPGGLGRGVAAVNGPGTNFLLPCSEIGLETEQPVAGTNEPIESCRLEAQRRQEIGAVFGWKLCQLGFDLGRKGHDLRLLAALPHCVSKRPEMRTFVARELSITHISSVQNRLRGQQRQRREDRFFCACEPRFPESFAFL